MNLTALANCDSCRTKAPLFCQSHTCLDCSMPVTDHKGHVCVSDLVLAARVARRVETIRL